MSGAWVWVLVALALLVVAAGMLALLLLRLWRATKALVREVERTASAVEEVAARLEDVPDPQPAHRPGTGPEA